MAELADVGGIFGVLGRNSVHPFPARMAPSLVGEVLAPGQEALRVLDPMAGSGTVVAAAQVRGHRAMGVDIDPLAVLITRVWTTSVDRRIVRERSTEVLAGARRGFQGMRVGDAYPEGADGETRRFVRYWFDAYARRQLALLAKGIREVEEGVVRDVLWCAFSRLIIAKQSGASRARDLPHSRPHRAYARAPAKPFGKFAEATERVLRSCPEVGMAGVGPVARVERGDARELDLGNDSVDLVLTSPPYMNAIDYFRCSKFSLVWMGYGVVELRRLRSVAVGTEVGKALGDDGWIRDVLDELELRPTLDARRQAMLVRYIDDMRRVVAEASRVLKKGGKAVYVVGENTVRGTFVRNSRIVERAADAAGLQCNGRSSRELAANRRYLPPPRRGSGSGALDGRMRREVVMTFGKAA